MSYFAIATNRFEEVVDFYVVRLGLPLLNRFDRPGARGAFVELPPGLRMEIIDASVQKRPMTLHDHADDRLHIVIETDDIFSTASRLSLPNPEATTWGATVVKLKDPDGLGVWLIEWDKPSAANTDS